MSTIMLRRLGAFIIDGLLISMTTAFLSGYMLMYADLGTVLLFGKEWKVLFGFSFLIVPAYFIAFDLVNEGITLGKSLFKIRVVAGGSRDYFSSGRRMMRSVVKSISTTIPLIALLFYLLKHKVIQDLFPENQTVRYHDRGTDF